MDLFIFSRRAIFISGISSPIGIAISPVNGNVYISDAGSNAIWQYSGLNGTFLGPFAYVYQVWGLAIAPTGNLYVTSAGSGVVSEFNPSGSLLTSFNTGVPIDGITVGPDGNIYVASNGPGGILRLTPQLSSAASFVPSSNLPWAPDGIKWGPDGYLYVGTTAGVLKYNAAGGLISSYYSGIYSTDVAFVSAGLLVAQTGTNMIELLDPSTGTAMGSFATGNGLNTPRYMAVQTPEPQTGIMAAAAIMAVGLHRWRKRVIVAV